MQQLYVSEREQELEQRITALCKTLEAERIHTDKQIQELIKERDSALAKIKEIIAGF